MKVWQHDWKVRVAHLLALSVLLSSGASSALAYAGDANAAGKHDKQGSKPACPSQDFTTFLQRYADASNDSVRLRFTDDPLEYEVPTHTVEDETPSSPPTHVSARSGLSRLELFPYRYFKNARAFDRIDSQGDQKTLQGSVPYPLAVATEPADGRKVDFGMEYETDTYLFKRKLDCWYLARVINLRD
ncbi:hypothetical protein [Xanthomonas medicagonis]|uniref:hypothetical protein n=1 Tax=Xanthomonas medicagonis TaxID=3160841 RepID=UPI0035134F77